MTGLGKPGDPLAEAVIFPLGRPHDGSRTVAPQGVANTIPAVWEVTEPSLSIVRMHGRNRDTWNRKGARHLGTALQLRLSADELKEVAASVNTLARKAERS